MKPAFLPRLGDWVFICIFLACLLLGQRMLNVDSDLGRHLALGRYMIDSGTIPNRDVLSINLTGQPRPAYEWLSQIAFELAERFVGLDGVVLLTAGIIAAAFLVVFFDARTRGAGLMVSLGLTIWAAVASSLHWLTRPHVFSFLFMAIWLCLLDRMRRGDRRTLWQLPLVMLLWANFHGGFVFGFVAWLAYALGAIIQRARSKSGVSSVTRLLLVGATSLLASLVTPSIAGNWSAVVRNSSPFVLSRTAETMPIALGAPGAWPFLGLIVLSVLLGAAAIRRLDPAHLLLLLFTGALGFAIMRNVPLFCIAAVPVLPLWEPSSRLREGRMHRIQARIEAIDSSIKGYAWSFLTVLLAGVILTAHHIETGRGFYSFDAARFPVAAVDWIAAHGLPDATFNDLNWGGYLLYRMWPEKKVFIDSQSDFYGESFIRQYLAIYGATGDWEGELDRLNISSAILPPDAPLVIEMQRHPDWEVVYQDGRAVVTVRRELWARQALIRAGAINSQWTAGPH